MPVPVPGMIKVRVVKKKAVKRKKKPMRKAKRSKKRSFSFLGLLWKAVRSRRFVEAIGLLVIIAAVFSFCSLISHSPDDPSFLTLLNRNEKLITDAKEHQDLPLARVLAKLEVPRLLSRPPLVQAAFAMNRLMVRSFSAMTFC